MGKWTPSSPAPTRAMRLRHFAHKNHSSRSTGCAHDDNRIDIALHAGLLAPAQAGKVTSQKSAAHHRARDDKSLDVRSAFIDLAHANVAVDAFDREIADITIATVDLDRVRTHALGDRRGEQLRHRSLFETGTRGVLQLGRMKRQLPGGYDARGRDGNAEGHGLMFADRYAERHSFLRVLQRRIQRG